MVKKHGNVITVTKTYLPSIDKYTNYLREIWKNGWLTNNGPFVIELEDKLKAFLNVKNLHLVANATLGLQIAIRCLDLNNSEIITTPFSYVATTSSIVWENSKPVFVDIDPESLCINPDLIEKAITKNTRGILAVHVFGNICEVEKIEKIAKEYNLKVIYDAAHTFGIKYKGRSILNYGDVSVLSFHATKVFQTVEGGALVTKNKSFLNRIFQLRNFGHKGYEKIVGIGTNAKMSELHAVMGLSVLPFIEGNIKKRKELSQFYDRNLPQLRKPNYHKNITRNYSYYPVIFKSQKEMLKAKRALEKNSIIPRRYFYPSLNKLSYVDNTPCPVSESISKKILCLPLYEDLTFKEIKNICDIINKI